MSHWLKDLTSSEIGYAVGFLGVFYSTRAVKSNELRKIRHEAFLEYSRIVGDGARIGDGVFVAKRGGHLSEEQIALELDKLNLEYNSWLAKVDKVEAAFMLAAPNYVSNAGRIFYQSARSCFSGRGTYRHYQYYEEKFRAAAKFDLRHYVFSYLRSVLYLVGDYTLRFLKWSWKIIDPNDRIVDWRNDRNWYRNFQNNRNAKFEEYLTVRYGINFIERKKEAEFDEFWAEQKKAFPV